MEKPVSDGDCRDHPGQFREQRAAQRMPDARDIHHAEIQRQHIESRFSGTLDDGRNGGGKSTIVKTLAEELPPINGEIVKHPKLKIGYFSQQQLDLKQSGESLCNFLKR